MSLTSVGSVFLLGAIGLGPSIPTGLALGLPPPVVMLLAATGSYVVSVVVVVIGGPLVNRILKGKQILKPGTPAEYLWRNFGVIGLGFLGPALIGPHVSCALSLVLGAKKRPILVWVAVGTYLVCTLYTTALALGFHYLEPFANKFPWIVRIMTVLHSI